MLIRLRRHVRAADVQAIKNRGINVDSYGRFAMFCNCETESDIKFVKAINKEK